MSSFTAGAILIIMVVIIVLAPLLFAIKDQDKAVARRKAREKWYDNAAKIRPGMSKDEVFALVGGNCTRSFLQDNTEICEWKMTQSGGSVTYYNEHRAVSEHYNGYEFSLIVKFKDDIAIEVTSGDRTI